MTASNGARHPAPERKREAEIVESHEKAKDTLERTAEALRRLRLLEAELALIGRGQAADER